MKRFIFSLIAVFELSVATMTATTLATYSQTEGMQTCIQSYEMQTDYDFVKVEFAGIDYAKMSVEKQFLSFCNIAIVCNVSAENSDIYTDNHFRLCGLFDNYKQYNTVFRYRKRYNYTTFYFNSPPFIYRI
jgi:hypothetical protein